MRPVTEITAGSAAAVRNWRRARHLGSGFGMATMVERTLLYLYVVALGLALILDKPMQLSIGP